MKRIILFILLLLSVGCSQFSSSPTQPTSILSPTLPVAPMTTSTILPSILTPTVDDPIPSPLPTLPLAEAEAVILDLLQNKNNCFLPCWWNLTPGKTSIQTAESLLKKLAANSLGITFSDKGGGASWLIDKNDLLLDIIVSITYNRKLSGTVESLRITTEVKKELEGGGFETVWENPLNEQLLSDYMLAQVLSVYGQPQGVLIFADKGWNYFELILDYSDQGFTIWYSAPLEAVGENFLGCPSKAFTKLYLWTPEFGYTWAEGVSGNEDKSEIDTLTRDFRPLEEITSLTLDELYEIFANADNVDCLETPKKLWPGP